MSTDPFRYDGKRALVVGAATGMGAATAQVVAGLGAEVVAVDIAEVSYDVAASHAVDLRDKDGVDALVAGWSEPFDAVFLCAGVADGTPGLMVINVISQRHLLDGLRAKGLLPRGSAVALISSQAGMGWMTHLPQLLDFLSAATWDDAVAWLEANPGNDHYLFSKQVINAYVAQATLDLLRDGIRLNAVLPGPTDTPLARANADTWLVFGADYRQAAGLATLTPEQMARPLAFLCSDAADGIAGVTLAVDQGQMAAAVTGTFPDELVSALLGIG